MRNHEGRRAWVSYLRVSTPEQAERDLSLPAQRRAVADYASRCGQAITCEYLEEGCSGTTMNRKAFRQMVEDVFRRGSDIGTIVVHHTSRFTRNATEARVVKEKFRKEGVRVVSVCQETNDDPVGQLIEGIFECIDQYESEVNGMRTSAAMREAVRQGYFPGARTPFGFTRTKSEIRPNIFRSVLVPDEAEAAIVRVIFQRIGRIYGESGRNSNISDVTLSTPAGPLLNGIGQPARTTFLYQRDDQPFGFGAAQTMPPFLPTHRSRFRIDSISALGTALVRDVFDINGDGIADLVDVRDCDSDWDVYLGSPSGFSATPLRWSHAPGCFFIRYRHTAGYSNVVTETVDINGDSIPDYIDARPDCVGSDCDFGSWKVYLGRVGSNGTGWGFEPTPIAWAKPVELEDEYTRWTRAYSIHTTLAGWNAPVVTRRDLIDMNADGLLDLVSTEDGNWRVWLNTGAGFAATPLQGFDAPYPFQRLSANGHEMIGVYDVNGDGLPDQIVACDRELHPSCPVGPFGGAAWDIYLKRIGRIYGESGRNSNIRPWADGHKGWMRVACRPRMIGILPKAGILRAASGCQRRI